MRVLLCLLSRHHVPNLLSVHHYRPDQLVLIASKTLRKRGADRNFLDALKLGGLDYSNRHHIEPLDLEYDLTAIREALQKARDRFPRAHWVVNLTGGSKPMSIAAYDFFKGRGGCKLIYANAARPSRFLDMEGGPDGAEIDYRLSIKEFLAGYGFEVIKPDAKLAEAEARARDWAPSARLLARFATGSSVLSLEDDERDSARGRGIKNLDPRRLNLPSPELRDEWVGGAKTLDLDRHQVEFLTGGWLEVFFWDLLRDHSEALGIWDVRLGLVVKSRGGRVENELDVSFMHGRGLSVIECKTGFQSDERATDALYKVEAIVGQFGARLVRSYLATTGDAVLNQRGEVREHLRDRASIYNCQILTRGQIQKLAGDGLELVRKLILGRPRRGGAEAL